MSMILRQSATFLACLVAVAAMAQDPSIEAGFRDDLTVSGLTGSKADPDLEVAGYAAFGTNYSGALFVTSGVGQVYIQRNLEVGSNVYARGSVIFADGTAQATAYNTNAVYTLASGEWLDRLGPLLLGALPVSEALRLRYSWLAFWYARFASSMPW